MTETSAAAAELGGLLARIHSSPVQLVLEFTGAGSQALAWLHSIGGSSRTVIEASDRYAPASLISVTGFAPERFTSAEVSRALAAAAYRRAKALAPDGTPVIGIGSSSTIATDRTKRGDHRTITALHGPFGSNTFELTLEKGERDRAGEEELVSRLILLAITDGSGLMQRPHIPLLGTEAISESFEPAPGFRPFSEGEVPAALLTKSGTPTTAPLGEPMVLLSGSFNPVHEGHLGLAAAAEARLGRPVTFELPLVNADKPGLDLLQAQRRAAQFHGRSPVLLSRAPLFVEKARLFPGSTFIIGADTAARLLDPRFYPDADGVGGALDELASLSASFVVAGRSRSGGDFVTLDGLTIPAGHADMFTGIDFRLDVSSTELRERRAA